MIQVNTIPKPEEGMNVSKVVIALNSVTDSPFSMQFVVNGFGKRTVKNDEGEDVDQWFPNPVYNGLFKIENETWSAWTPEAASSDNDYVAGLVLSDLNLEKEAEAEVEEVQVVNEAPVAEEATEEAPAE